MENNQQIQRIEPVTAKELTSYLDVMGLSTQLTDKEKVQFLEISQAFGLNPFKREIYCSKYNNQTSIIVGYETYIKRAERSGKLDGWQVITEGKVEDNSLKAIITIYRKDRKIPFIHEVYYSEYVQKTREGVVNKFWQKAFTMTKKVAIAQGFRLCFSDELGGMPYTADELDTQTEDIQSVVIESKPIEITITDTKKDTESVISLLNEATSLDELVVIWGSLNAYQKNLPTILEHKDNLKNKGYDTSIN
jgi:phage recombination protein Bet